MFTSARAGFFATRFRVGVANTHQPPYATMLKPSLAVLLQCRVWHAGTQLPQHLHHFRGIPVFTALLRIQCDEQTLAISHMHCVTGLARLVPVHD